MGKLFGTDGIRGIAGEELTAEIAFRLGLSLSKVLHKENGGTPSVIIGKDTRLSGDMLEAALSAGLCSMGCNVYLVGVVPTPAVAYLIVKNSASAGVMISASHNPSEYNGLKVFGPKGMKLPDELENEIENLIENDGESFSPTFGIGKVLDGNGMLDDYENHIKERLADCREAKRSILFDLSNGSASNTAKSIFNRETLPFCQCDFMAFDPNGININLNCGSTQMSALCKYVTDGGYDIGIAFDGDADRCLMCDENGEIIDGDKIIAALASEMKKDGTLDGNTAVVTKLSNLGFSKMMKEEGIEVHQTDVGDRYVLEEMLRCGSRIGGEQSGHIILSRYATTGDGQLTAAAGIGLLCRYPDKKASEIFGKMKKYPQVSVNVTVPNAMKKVIMSDPDVENEKNRIAAVLGDNGRIILRPSGTEALIRIMLEGPDTDTLRSLAEGLKAIITEKLNVQG